MVPPIKVIVADDDPDARDLLQHQLESDRCKVTVKESCEDLLATLNKKPDKFDVVLLDFHFNGAMNGLDCLREIKANIHLRDLPVILQTAEKDSEHVSEAMYEGAFYFLEKTTKRKVIRSVVLSAMESSLRYLNIDKKRIKLANSLKYLEDATFKIKTIKEMETLTALLCEAYPDPDTVMIGIHELLTNAIEHGNLEINYDAKSKLILKDLWQSEVENRLQLKKNKDKYVEVNLQKTKDAIILTIQDQGNGFDAEAFLNFDKDRLFDAHGRGIAVARSLSFDEVEYLGSGNTVRTKVYLKKS